MADLKDDLGRPVELTDEMGNPVVLTDSQGNRIHISGVATAEGVAGAVDHRQPLQKLMEEEQQQQQLRSHEDHTTDLPRSSTSSSSSSEDDGKGGRRKKAGLGQKIKEKLTGGKHKDEEVSHQTQTHSEYHHEREKKSMMEKIKDRLPGHHNHT